jgi:hypothetical protein
MATAAAVRIHPDTNKLTRPLAICGQPATKVNLTKRPVCQREVRDCALLVNSLQSLSVGAICHKFRRVSPQLTTKALP